MDQDKRNKLQRATQQIRRLLEDEFTEQLEGTFDILPSGKILESPGKHLNARERLVRRKLVEAIQHIKAGGKQSKDAVEEYTREAAFTFLNRFVALRMLEARGMVQECVSKGDASSGFKEFCGLSAGLSSADDGGYQLYLECLLDELSVEVELLFDRRDSASLLWPRRGPLTEVLDILGQADLAGVWSEDETIGWVYQYFNSEDERRDMRADSRAPRNSRDLAVRNQFFTPRYVVEFLTDNTLGRIWYEMHQGETKLTDVCRYLICRPNEVFLDQNQEPPAQNPYTEEILNNEGLLKQTVYIPYRAKKDPRDLKILDPACGSGHFLLYAFDLLILIYVEAWNDESSPKSEITGRRLRDDYCELEHLYAALPGLVLAHNLHGIDIDPRATQIAVLALWMRGQWVFSEARTARDRRQPIVTSNIVCAEPMPGEPAFLDEFIVEHLSNDAEGPFLGNLVRKVFESMQVAGEAGSLLRIEDNIAEEVEKAKKQWLERPKFKQQKLFEDSSQAEQRTLDLTRGITDESFWEEAEERIYEALREYSEHVERSGGFQRRLFVADTSRGFAFIDLCRRHYDIVLINPPFGHSTQGASLGIEHFMSRSGRDLGAAFVRAAAETWCNDAAFIGVIISAATWFKPSYSGWRENILLGKQVSLDVAAHLGGEVLDGASVNASPFTVRKGSTIPALILRLRHAPRGLSEELRTKVISVNKARECPDVFVGIPKEMAFLAGSPLSYWVSHRLRAQLKRLPTFESEGRTVKQGMINADEFRFTRLWWELSDDTEGWSPYVKGSEYSPYWDCAPFVVRAANRFAEVSSTGRARLQGVEYFGRCGVTIPIRSVLGFNPRLLPSNAAFSNLGSSAFDESIPAAALLAALASRPAEYLISLFLGDLQGKKGVHPNHYDVGVVQRIPWPSLSDQDIQHLNNIGLELVANARMLQDADECHRNFVCPVLMPEASLSENVSAFKEREERIMGAIRELRGRADVIVERAYGFEESDLSIMREAFGEMTPPADGHWRLYFGEPGGDVTISSVAESILLWLFGVAIGRWRPEHRYEPPTLALPSADEIPYGLISEHKAVAPGVLTDDEGNQFDLVRAIESAPDRAGLCADLSCAQILRSTNYSVRGQHEVRHWFRTKFFDVQLKRYSSQRRRAPIYLQLATPTAFYSVWVYYHWLTKDTFFTIEEIVNDKLKHERKKLDRFRDEAGAEPSRSQLKEIDDQEKFVIEVITLTEEVERIAPLWNPNLNDGVIINFSPLWRLVPQNKSWQRECKSCWDKLVKGDYDWAHLAMHLWPERVVPKCVTDASLAIAHGLEEVFWEQDDRERFQPKDGPDGGWEPTIERLVKERSSPAVKAALQSLLDAPVPSSSSGRSRRRRTGS